MATSSEATGGFSHQRGGLFFEPPAPPAYYAHLREEICAAQGKFVFSDLPDGEYYLTTSVTWLVGDQQQGGSLMQRVLLVGGGTKRVLMTS